MTAPILYCGDTSLESAAAYLAGLLSAWEWPFDYLPSHSPADAAQITGRQLVILSDYPSDRMSPQVQQQLIAAVQGGCGLLMIGGWESFHGLGGDWDQTPVADILPVEILSRDDRLNCDQPVIVRHVGGESIVADLPWEQRPPVIGGFNQFRPRDSSRVVLEVDRLSMSYHNGDWTSRIVQTHPLLVLGEHGTGRTAAVATDVAPHWVGGFVDWGSGRISGQAPGAEAIEVGDLYAGFWRRLLTYLAKDRSQG